MKHFLLLLCFAAISAATSPALMAGFDFLGCRKPDGCAENCCAPACRMVCCPECKTVKEKVTCFDVECEYVCIPPVTLPKCGGCLGRLCGLRECSSDCPDTCSLAPSCGGCGAADCAQCCQMTGGTCCQNNSSLFGRMKNKLCGCRVRKVSRLKAVSSEKEKQVVEWTVHTYALPTCKSCCGAAPHCGCGPCGE